MRWSVGCSRCGCLACTYRCASSSTDCSLLHGRQPLNVCVGTWKWLFCIACGAHLSLRGIGAMCSAAQRTEAAWVVGSMGGHKDLSHTQAPNMQQQNIKLDLNSPRLTVGECVSLKYRKKFGRWTMIAAWEWRTNVGLFLICDCDWRECYLLMLFACFVLVFDSQSSAVGNIKSKHYGACLRTNDFCMRSTSIVQRLLFTGCQTLNFGWVCSCVCEFDISVETSTHSNRSSRTAR